MRFFKEFGFSLVWTALFSLLVIIMANHFHQIDISNGPLDEEAAMLKEIRKHIPESTKASFATNLRDDEASHGAYYQTQFAWCPMILSDNAAQSDNIIYYRSSSARDSDMAFLHGCDTLYLKDGSSYTLLLLHKTKNQ
jgi:hypothetical protein